MNDYLQIYENDFYLLNNFTNERFDLVGLNQTSFLTSLINYYRLILNYTHQQSLHVRTIDIAQKLHSTVSISLGIFLFLKDENAWKNCNFSCLDRYTFIEVSSFLS